MPTGSIGQRLRALIAEHLLIAGVMVFVLSLALGYFLLYRPEWRRIKAADSANRLEQERQAKADYLGKLEELEKDYLAFEAEDVAKIRAMIPDEEDIPGLLAMFEASARASDMSLTAINFSKGEKTGGVAAIKDIEVINAAVSLEHGDYRSLKLYLEALETNLRLFDVRSANLNPEGAQYTLTIRTYYRGKPPA